MTSADSYISSRIPRKQSWRQSFDVKEVLSQDASEEDQTELRRKEGKPGSELHTGPSAKNNCKYVLVAHNIF